MGGARRTNSVFPNRKAALPPSIVVTNVRSTRPSSACADMTLPEVGALSPIAAFHRQRNFADPAQYKVSR